MRKTIYFSLILIITILMSGCGSPDIAVFSEDLDIHEGKLEVINIETEHKKVHDGEASRFWTSFSVAGNSQKYLMIDIDENALHFKERNLVISNNNAEVYYKVYIDSDATGGTLIDNVYNSNTYTNKVDNTSFYLDPIITTLGSETDQIMIPDTNRAGSSSSDAFEWLYKNNTILVVEIENTGTQEIEVNLRYKWYVDEEY